MKVTKENFWLCSIFLISFISTSFCFYWTYKNSFNLEKVLILTNYPYLKISLILTITTFLFGRISFLENLSELPNHKKMIGDSALAYYFVVIFMNLILYPGTETLKIASDSNGFLVFFITSVIQALTFKCIISLLKKNNKYLKDIFVLVIVSLLLIFSGKYIIKFLPNSNARNLEYLQYD